VSSGRDGVQVWRVAANILKKQSRTAKRGSFSSFRVGHEIETPHRKRTFMLRNGIVMPVVVIVHVRLFPIRRL
jgi:hypothetical protein